MDQTTLKLVIGAWFVVIATPAWAAEQADSCVACHEQWETDATSPTKLMAHDVHAHRGLSCADCHGGDPTSMDPAVAMAPPPAAAAEGGAVRSAGPYGPAAGGGVDPAKGFLGRPARAEIPQFCARCHADPAYMRKYNPNLPTDQYAKYLTSQHGKKNSLGDPDVAVCTSCHTAHGIRAKKDPLAPVYPTNIPATCASCHTNAGLMERHGLPMTQYLEYSQSIHGQALLGRHDRAAPHCASCHGSHEASRPGMVAIGNVCAQCHGLTRDLFAKSPHKRAHEVLGLPECEVCHGKHLIHKPSDEMLGIGPTALCVSCHEPDSKGFLTAQQMREAIEHLKTHLASAEGVVGQASQFGMDVGEAEFALHEATAKLTQARTYVHSFAIEAMRPIADEGIRQAQLAEEGGQRAIHAFHFRRQGLWVTLIILSVMVLGLLLLIREIERSRPNGPS